MNILIADDHALFRDGLKKIILEKINDVQIGEAENYAELLNILTLQKWDLVLLDLNMPGRSGFDALLEIKSLYPEVAVLILSMYPEEQFAIRVIRAGAAGYLTKSITPKELCEAINTVGQGKQYFTKSVSSVMASEIRSGKINLIDKLSDREYQVFLLIASGKGLTEIGKELSLSVKTISTYRTHILEKLNLESNAQIVKLSIENKLI